MNELSLRLVLVAVLSLGLGGCTGMADFTSQMGGLGILSEDVSTFDGSKTIEVSPQFLYDPKHVWGNSYKLGARWNSRSPGYVALVMSYDSSTSGYGKVYANLTGMDVSLNGKEHSFDAGAMTDHDDSGWNSYSQTIYTESRNSVIVPLSLVEQMVQAEDVRIRIHSSEGYEDSIFSVERRPGGQGLALLSIREFIDRVHEEKVSMAIRAANK